MVSPGNEDKVPAWPARVCRARSWGRCGTTSDNGGARPAWRLRPASPPTLSGRGPNEEPIHEPSRRSNAAEDPGHLPALGHRGRPGHLRRVLRLELRLGLGGHARLSRHVGVRRPDVRHLHLQLHRADDRDPARRRPVRVQPPRVRRRPAASSPASRRWSSSCSRRRPSRWPSAPTSTCSSRRSSRAGSPFGAYVVFMALNIAGMTIAASFELVVTLVAIFELCVFMGVVAPGFSLREFRQGRLGRRATRSACRLGRASSPPSRSRSGSSSPSKASRWPPRR